MDHLLRRLAAPDAFDELSRAQLQRLAKLPEIQFLRDEHPTQGD